MGGGILFQHLVAAYLKAPQKTTVMEKEESIMDNNILKLLYNIVWMTALLA